MFKLICVAIVCGILILYLRSVNPELSPLAIIGSGVIILSASVDYLFTALSFLSKLSEDGQINGELIKVIFKIISIGYLTEFASSTLEDFGLKSLSNKIVFVGKVLILCVSIPVIEAVYRLICEIAI